MGSRGNVFLKLKPDAGDRMKHIENEVARTVLQYRDNTEAAIVIFALLRVARKLLLRYPTKTKVLLRNECCDFLEEKVDGQSSSLVTLN